MKINTFRLKPNQDLKKSLQEFVNINQIQAGVILTCVGSLNKAILRMADENIIKTFDEKFEIVSLIGTLSTSGCHLHISLSDKNGNVIGGHLKEGCIIYTTAEIVIGELQNATFNRELDKNTGFKELIISTKQIN
ncbi:DNA-binding protein [Patescibacteria group bacterium]|nr:DNA-binding protein [Patescibacteria group bacterium]